MIRASFIALGLLVFLAAILIPPPIWKSGALAIVGGASGITWAYLQYRDEKRAAPRPARSFTLLFFACFSFLCLAAAEIAQVLAATQAISTN